MGEAITIGLDIAKSVFQVHGVDAEGAPPVLRRQLRGAELLRFFGQPPRCLFGIEALRVGALLGAAAGRVGA
jgi:transposase